MTQNNGPHKQKAKVIRHRFDRVDISC